MMNKLIDGSSISRYMQASLSQEIESFKQSTGVTPGLAVVLVGDDPASAVYVKSKGKASVKLGMHSSTVVLPQNASRSEVLNTVHRLNENTDVHGILVQLPLPSHLDANDVIDAIRPEKDVDGLHPANAGLLALGRPRFVPCTPAGILELLKSSDIKTSGKHVVVVGRSNLVGRPIATLLSSKGEPGDATVTLCHSRTKEIAEVTRSADILIVAIGQPKFIKADMVREGSTVIDVGIHRLPESEGSGLCGDVDFEAVSKIAAAITPVPGGVGPMTIAMLMHNTLLAAKLLHR
ncbi:MAG: bifunctional methylenetetrahydrofolate dehydrogenase/methenyltetrahydrofolate cyclohydrolase FolD [Calditrichaeota bacterium]|nr:bifunctional methylenetetrahydrofolate dehydrogenase/methenyltetrahydrofolate cyclohydrolase FolD [Calditrichota bacterium]MCB9366508.1 bifunctional methylenetetrahydrofolate dehydrogenase/methenyltetrahydrofolate cyclohydrolase FolD [Calditrichota bacterium]MCB9391234.1 bifunctional methylenetetrahydrofolate dehydrogenase/methenyltetrahydrofolate cyclohydrolase FolD [Calditrichota bacterium]